MENISGRVARELAVLAAANGRNGEAIARYGAFVASEVEVHDQLPRAMDLARDYIDASGELPLASGRVILARRMSGSKGRFTRSWHAPEGGIWGCLIHANTLLASSRQYIPFAVGVASCEMAHACGLDAARLRWVNDLLHHGSKLAGFLIESYQGAGETFNLIGFGINVNNSEFPEELQEIASSLAAELGKTLELQRVVEIFLARLAWNIGVLYFEEEHSLREGTFSDGASRHPMVTRFLQLSDTVGERVQYGFDVMTAPQYQAVVQGIDDGGGLILQLDDGHCTREYSGEVRYLRS